VPGVDVFYAEQVWEQIASRANRSALKMESDLAALADLVIIIVESPGTFAELGAFSLSDELRKKVLPVIDQRYRNEESFIATGPVRWIDSDSRYSPTIYVPLSRILEAADQVEDRISRISRSHTTKISDISKSARHLLFFLCDLICVIHPASVEMVEYYVKRIAPAISASNTDISMLLGLGAAMELLREDRISDNGIEHILYSPAQIDSVERPFHHARLLDLQSLRASHISALLSIPQALRTITLVRHLHDR
jgi:hypothetical protein